MARTTPALPVTMIDPVEVGPGQPILGGGSGLMLIAQACNLAIATLGTGVLWQQVWADGQFSVTASDDTDLAYRIRIPYVSALHLTATLSVQASGGGTSADFVRVTCPANAETERTADIGSLATYSVDIDLAAGVTATAIDGGRDYYDLHIFVGGTVNVRALQVTVGAAQAVAGSWPGSDGTLAHARVDGAPVLDEFMLEEEEAVSTLLGQAILDVFDGVRDRVRVRHSWSGVYVPTPTASLYPEMPPILQRVEGHCLVEGEPLRAAGFEPAHLLEVWFYAVSDTEENVLVVERLDGEEVGRLVVAAGVTGWQHLWVDPTPQAFATDDGDVIDPDPLVARLRIRAAGARPALSRDSYTVQDQQDADNHVSTIVLWGP